MVKPPLKGKDDLQAIVLFFDQLCYSPMLQIMSDYALARLFSDYALDIAHLRSKALLLYASGRRINLQSEGCEDFSWSSIESTDRDTESDRAMEKAKG